MAADMTGNDAPVSLRYWVEGVEAMGLPEEARICRLKELVKEAFADSLGFTYVANLPASNEACKRFGVIDRGDGLYGSDQPGVMGFDDLDKADQFYTKHRRIMAQKMVDLDTGEVMLAEHSVKFKKAREL